MHRTVVVLLASLLVAVSLAAEQPDMQKALAQLQSSPADVAKAVDFILANSPRAPAPNLYLAAAGAQAGGRVQDAAFLFYAAQLRARFDLKRYPAKGRGGDSPEVAIAALNQQIGASVNPAIMRQPKSFSAVVERIAAWNPATPMSYDPGWEFTSIADAEGKAELKKRHDDFVTRFRGLATLLNDPEYFAAFKTLQDYNLGGYEQAQDPSRIKAKDAAEKTMRGIEEKRRIEGIFYHPSAK